MALVPERGTFASQVTNSCGMQTEKKKHGLREYNYLGGQSFVQCHGVRIIQLFKL